MGYGSKRIVLFEIYGFFFSFFSFFFFVFGKKWENANARKKKNTIGPSFAVIILERVEIVVN
jgi:hypothetical protein